jgi:hypothetical protein
MCRPSLENFISEIDAMISVKNDLNPWDPPSCNLQNQTPYEKYQTIFPDVLK